LGGGGNGISWDGSAAYSSSLLEDVVVWGSSAGGIASNGSPNVGTITRATVKSGGTGFADWDGGSRLTISSSIAYQNSNSACESVSASSSVSFDNGSNNWHGLRSDQQRPEVHPACRAGFAPVDVGGGWRPGRSEHRQAHRRQRYV